MSVVAQTAVLAGLRNDLILSNSARWKALVTELDLRYSNQGLFLDEYGRPYCLIVDNEGQRIAVISAGEDGDFLSIVDNVYYGLKGTDSAVDLVLDGEFSECEKEELAALAQKVPK